MHGEWLRTANGSWVFNTSKTQTWPTHPVTGPGPTIEMWVSKSMKDFISVFYSRSQTATGLDKSLQARVQ
uniref:Uncharacterized protein n=1 Tax=Anguilla anguilla TaxID=7936 RepID=A0A0E9WWC8_ANGAN